MTKQSKELPARKSQVRDDSLLLRSAESLGRMIGSLQRQLDLASKSLSGDGHVVGDHAGAATKKPRTTSSASAPATRPARSGAAATRTKPATSGATAARKPPARKRAKSTSKKTG